MGYLGLHSLEQTAPGHHGSTEPARCGYIGNTVLHERKHVITLMLSLRGLRAEEAEMPSRGHKKSEINKVNLENSEASDLSFSMDKPNNPEETINIQIDRLPIKTAADSSGKDLFTQKAIIMGNRVRFRPICSKLGKSKWNHS